VRRIRARAIRGCWDGIVTGDADVAQLVERRLPKPKVVGSRPIVR
jgi:hypothetical protein